MAGLIGLASQLTKICYACYGYCEAAKKAPETVREVICKLGLLRRALQDLEEIYNCRTQPLYYVGNIIQTLSECEKDIVAFTSQLNPEFRGFRGTLDRLTWPRKKEQVMKFIEQLKRHKEYFDSAKSSDGLLLAEKAVTLAEESLAVGNETLDRAREIQQNSEEERKKVIRSKLLEWLSPLDFYNLQEELYHGRRTKGSSTWILGEKTFRMWRDSRAPMHSSLWCFGDPGSGKTIIRYAESHLEHAWPSLILAVLLSFTISRDVGVTMALLISTVIIRR
jgi:hypothetical protein